MNRVQFDREKLADVVHYVSHRCTPEELGYVKLHKILYFADMMLYASSGRPLTGVEYQKQPFGPVARHLTPALQQLEESGRIRTRTRDYFGYPKLDVISLRDPELSRFSEPEIRLLDDVSDFVCARSAREMSELSHNAAWEAAEMGEVIPYFTAFGLFPTEVTDEDVEWSVGEAQRVAVKPYEPAGR